MAKPIALYLLKEHAFVAEIIEAISGEMRLLRARATPDAARMSVLFGLFEDFIAQTHEEKEERIIFPEVCKIQGITGGPRCIYYKELQMQRRPVQEQVRGIDQLLGLDASASRAWEKQSFQGTIISPLVEEHLLGRSLVRLMRHELIERLSGRNPDNGDLFLTLYRYRELLREHAEKEDTCFGHTLDAFLPDEVQEDVMRELRKFDEERGHKRLDEARRALASLNCSAHFC